MRLRLIRHAEPDWSPGGRLSINPELTDRGHDQAARLAERLSKEPPPDRLLASHARRTQQTVAPVTDALQQPVETAEWLHEVHILDLVDGHDMAAYIQRIRQPADRPYEMWDDADGTCEPRGDFQQRVRTGLLALLAEYDTVPIPDRPGAQWQVGGPDPTILLFCHGGVIAAIITTLLDIPVTPWDWERFVAGYTSVTELVTHPVGGGHIWQLRQLGEASHLDHVGEGVSGRDVTSGGFIVPESF